LEPADNQEFVTFTAQALSPGSNYKVSAQRQESHHSSKVNTVELISEVKLYILASN